MAITTKADKKRLLKLCGERDKSKTILGTMNVDGIFFVFAFLFGINRFANIAWENNSVINADKNKDNYWRSVLVIIVITTHTHTHACIHTAY